MKNKRLMEAFKKTSQEVREVCYHLTGYRIDIPTSSQYRIRSIYAESPNDFLMFQVGEKKNVILTAVILRKVDVLCCLIWKCQSISLLIIFVKVQWPIIIKVIDLLIFV